MVDPDNQASHFCKPGSSCGQSALPQVGLIGLVETKAHALVALAMAPYKTGEHTLAKQVVPKLTADMLGLTDLLLRMSAYGNWQEAERRSTALAGLRQ